jgi:hypothetical protein
MMGAKRDACPHAEWMKIHINLHDARVLKLMSMGVGASQLVCPDALRAAGAARSPISGFARLWLRDQRSVRPGRILARRTIPSARGHRCTARGDLGYVAGDLVSIDGLGWS